MIWSLTLFQAILMKATVSFAAEDNSLSRSAYLVTRENKHLADHVVKQFESPSLMACSQSCLRKSWCTSTNFKPKSSGQETKATCELNMHEFDPINDNSKLVDQQGTIFSMFLKGCLMSGCLNGGSCRFDQKEETFTCACKPSWSGDKCEAEFMNSSILSTNESYFNYLGKFLESAVGKESSVGFGNTSNAFIFSLNNKEGLAPFKSNLAKPSRPILRSSAYGPIFGRFDIVIANDANSNNDSVTAFGFSYSVPSEVQNSDTILAGSFYFSPDDVEVFYLDSSH